MLSRDLVPITSECLWRTGIGKPLRIAVDNRIGARGCGTSLFSEKIPQARQFNDAVRRQNRANQISLRHGVDFIQMTLRFGCNINFRMHSSRVPSMIM
jgi:hypothetical protein